MTVVPNHLPVFQVLGNAFQEDYLREAGETDCFLVLYIFLLGVGGLLSSSHLEPLLITVTFKVDRKQLHSDIGQLAVQPWIYPISSYGFVCT